MIFMILHGLHCWESAFQYMPRQETAMASMLSLSWNMEESSAMRKGQQMTSGRVGCLCKVPFAAIYICGSQNLLNGWHALNSDVHLTTGFYGILETQERVWLQLSFVITMSFFFCFIYSVGIVISFLCERISCFHCGSWEKTKRCGYNTALLFLASGCLTSYRWQPCGHLTGRCLSSLRV